jgi:hypothetical protein
MKPPTRFVTPLATSPERLPASRPYRPALIVAVACCTRAFFYRPVG